MSDDDNILGADGGAGEKIIPGEFPVDGIDGDTGDGGDSEDEDGDDEEEEEEEVGE